MKRAREQAEDEAQSKPTSNSPLRRPSHLSCRTATAEVEAGTPSRPAAPRPTAAEGSQPASEGARTGAGSRRVSTRHLEGLAGQQQANFLSSAGALEGSVAAESAEHSWKYFQVGGSPPAPAGLLTCCRRGAVGGAGPTTRTSGVSCALEGG